MPSKHLVLDSTLYRFDQLSFYIEKNVLVFFSRDFWFLEFEKVLQSLVILLILIYIN